MFSKHKTSTVLMQEPEHASVCCPACDPLEVVSG